MSMKLKDTAAINISGNAASADSASKLGTADVGSAVQPIYLEEGVATATTYKLESSVPSNAVFTDTTYSAGTGISLNGTTFSHGDTSTLSGSYGPTAAVTGTDGTTINVPQITVDEFGHVTGVTNRTYTSKNTTYTASTGLSLSGTAFSAKLKSTTASTLDSTAMGSTEGRQYAVGVDKSGYLSVNIPWTDANTTYAFSASSPTLSWGTTSTIGTAGSTEYKVTMPALPTYSDVGAAAESHTHSYAGSLTVGGSAISAAKLDTTTAGSATKPVYFANGVPTVCSYELNTDVPSNAVFTDTTYTAGTGITLSSGAFSLTSGVVTAGSAGPTAAVSGTNGTTVAIPRITVDTYGRVTALTSYEYTSVNTDTNTTYSVATASANGLMAAADKSLSNFMRNVTTATTLASLNVSYSTIYATLSAATSISLSGTLTTGRSMTVFCYPSASFTQAIPNSGSYISMDGDSLSVTSGKWFEINIYAYASGKYSISCKTQA